MSTFVDRLRFRDWTRCEPEDLAVAADLIAGRCVIPPRKYQRISARITRIAVVPLAEHRLDYLGDEIDNLVFYFGSHKKAKTPWRFVHVGAEAVRQAELLQHTMDQFTVHVRFVLESVHQPAEDLHHITPAHHTGRIQSYTAHLVPN
ncbi:MAG: hypothetical protein ABW190_00740 [Rhizobacter sp.]